MASANEFSFEEYKQLLNERFRPFALEVKEMRRKTGGNRKELGLFSLRKFKEGDLVFLNSPLASAVHRGRCATCWRSSPESPWCCEDHRKNVDPNLFDIPSDIRLAQRVQTAKDLPDNPKQKILATRIIDFQHSMYHKPTEVVRATQVEASNRNINVKVETLAKFQCNAFGATNFKSQAVASGVYLGAILNHSCDPNCVLTYESHGEFEDKIEIQAVRVIRPISKGEELVHSYLPLHDPKLLRQAKLHEIYGFHCECTRCANPKNAMDNLLHAPLTRKGEIAERIARKWLEAANEEEDLQKEYELVRKAANAISILPPTHFLSIACIRYLWQICQTKFDLHESLRLGKSLLAVYDLVSPQYYPEKIHVEFISNLISRQLGLDCNWKLLWKKAKVIYGKNSQICNLILDLQRESAI